MTGGNKENIHNHPVNNPDGKGDKMNYIGVDLHKDSMSIVGINENDVIFVKERIPTKCTFKIEEFFSRDDIKPFKIACEAVGFYHWFYDICEGKTIKFILANPIEVKKYSWNEPKTDFKDATKLAYLLKNGEFDRNKSLSCYVPTKIERTFREITRQRANTVRRKVSLINSARRIFLKNNLCGPKIITSHSLCSFIDKFYDKFNEYHIKFLFMISENLFYIERQISEIEREIYKFLSIDKFKKMHQIITTIPGIGDMVSATLISEIGDFERFTEPEYLSSYAGLVPKVFQSGDKTRYGKITKQGSTYIRRALINASWVSIREDEKIRRIFTRIAKRRGRKKAIVAISRRLLCWCWHLVINNETWNEFIKNPMENRSAMTLKRFLNKIEERDEFIKKNSVA